MMMRFLPLHRSSLALVAALVMTACGGGNATTPSPAPTPVPTPIPEPTPEPTPTTSCSPLPPSVRSLKVKIQAKNREYWDIDATILVGPDHHYCASVGFTDDRSICTVRPEGDPQRGECERYAIGIATDTGQPGPTWTRNGEFCTGKDSGCERDPHNLFQLRVYTGGLIKACAENKACGEVFADKDL